MAYKQKGFPMHSTSALKQGMMKRRGTKPTEPEREAVSEGIGTMESTLDPIISDKAAIQAGRTIASQAPVIKKEQTTEKPEKTWQETVSEKQKAGIGYQTTYKKDESGKVIESGITFDDGTYLPD
tara:strand:- start:24 stop:398 length:375 start_codon:yes stop_codon:yes gene_type:complete